AQRIIDDDDTALAVVGDHVAGAGCRPPDRVPAGPIADVHSVVVIGEGRGAGGVGAVGGALHVVVHRRVRAIPPVDAEDVVARDDVAGAARRPPDRVLPGRLDHHSVAVV